MKDQIEQFVADAIAKLPGIESQPGISEIRPEIERTRDSQHGDYACNIAMRLAKPLRTKPRDLAQSIIDLLPESESIGQVEIAGPGFINFYLSPQAFHREILSISEQAANYGCSNKAAGEMVLLEFVSANPTGPLHVGHGRHAAYGASVANLLTATGHDPSMPMI